jgi:hypothetical protein
MGVDVSHWQGEDVWTVKNLYPPEGTLLTMVDTRIRDHGLDALRYCVGPYMFKYAKEIIERQREETFSPAIPKQIIFNGVTTICIFPGGEKIISRPSNDDDFDPEFGVMACIMKRIYGSRNKFKKAVAEGHRQDG